MHIFCDQMKLWNTLALGDESVGTSFSLNVWMFKQKATATFKIGLKFDGLSSKHLFTVISW